MKKVIVTLASVALAGALNFGMASAHPYADPTPPPSAAPSDGKPTPGALQGSEADDEQQGDNQSGDVNEVDGQSGDTTDSGDKQDGEQSDAEDAAGAATASNENDAQDQQGQQGQNDRNTQQDGEFEGDY